tara:strand:+ start:1123 stop:1416 length:294 start_codon:yes stop_codon:yes gene_type:complete
MFEIFGDAAGAIAGGVAGITGAGVLIGRQAKRIASAKAAYREVSDAFVALGVLSTRYKEAAADGTITPTEAEYVVQQVGTVVRETLEARESLDKVIS